MATANVALIQRWFDEVWNFGLEAAIDELLKDDVIAHGLSPVGLPVIGKKGFYEFYGQFRGAFPDIRVTIEDVVSDGDKTATRLSATATHLGDQLGIAATGKKIAITAMVFARWDDGQIAEAWNLIDMQALLSQIQ
jgi:steroid delta-isomerase-like uncharacterized protein